MISISLGETWISLIKEAYASSLYFFRWFPIDLSLVGLVFYCYMLLFVYCLGGDIYHAKRARSLTWASLLITSSHLAIIVRENSAPPWERRHSRLWLYLNSLSKDTISTFNGVNLMLLTPLGLLSRFHKSLLSHVLPTLVKTKEVLLSLDRTFIRDHHWRNWDEIVLLNKFFRIDKL